MHHKIYFGDGKHRFYMELYCGNSCEDKVCIKCSVKNQTKVQDCRTFDHGHVDGPYPDKSQLYDSPYYHKYVEKYGPPNAEDLEKAMEAQKRARAKKPPADPSEPKEKEKTKAKPRRKATKDEPVCVEPAKEQPITQIPTMVTFAETTDEPMEVSEVVTIVLKKFQHKGKTYWRDAEREKLYTCTASGARGGYVGRWDSTANAVDTDAPDSDADA